MNAARRTALFGFGNVAEHGHLPGWLARDDFRIVAVADPDLGRRALAERLLPGARLYEKPEDLLHEQRPDVVAVATPPRWHAPLARAAAAAGCQVLCEKPLATLQDDRDELLRVAGEAGVTLFTVHNWKHSAHFAGATALLAEGAIGKLVRVRLETVRTESAVSVGAGWRRNRDLAGGGILVDHGWHALYLLVSLVGRRPTHVSARLDRATGEEVEHSADCRLDFGPVVGEIHLTWAGAERRTTWTLAGSEGTMIVEDARLSLRRGDERRQHVFPASLSEGSHHPDWFAGVLDDFVCEMEDPFVRGCNLAEADLCMTLIRLAYESDARGGLRLPVPAPASARAL